MEINFWQAGFMLEKYLRGGGGGGAKDSRPLFLKQ